MINCDLSFLHFTVIAARSGAGWVLDHTDPASICKQNRIPKTDKSNSAPRFWAVYSHLGSLSSHSFNATQQT